MTGVRLKKGWSLKRGTCIRYCKKDNTIKVKVTACFYITQYPILKITRLIIDAFNLTIYFLAELFK